MVEKTSLSGYFFISFTSGLNVSKACSSDALLPNCELVLARLTRTYASRKLVLKFF